MNKKYYIKLMSANLFEENKSSKKDYKENPLVQMINASEEDKNASNINNQEKQNELKDKGSEIEYSNNQSGGGLFNINNSNFLFGIINKIKSLFGNSINNNDSNNSLFDLSNNNKEDLSSEKAKINYNQTKELFENSTIQRNKKTYSTNENATSDNIINQFEDNEKNDEDENTLAKIINEIKDNENNIDASTIENQEKPDSSSDDSLIELKDKIPDIKIKEEIIEISQNFLDLKNNNNNICEKCGKNNNYYCCENCSTIFCDICSKVCKKKHQNKLIELKVKIEYYKKEIEKIIQEYFSEPKNKEINAEKDLKRNQLNDKNKINDEPVKKLEYKNDIILIKSIIDSNYNNYFYYKIIEKCYKYMKREYDINDQILIEYEIKSDETHIKIFGYDFVKKNKGKCFIIFEDKEFELDVYFELKNNVNNNILKIKLIGINNVTDMSWMFFDCSSLISLPDISKWNTNNVKDMYYMFYNCSSLISLPAISKWNTNNVTNMSAMFDDCSSLISLPDISKWNTNNVTNMSLMFSNCSSLISLPDISKWNINNDTNMSAMFDYCSSLISLPDISKWNINNDTNMSYMFYNCSSLISLPDISKWNINNDTNMYEMFSNCSSLIYLPDLSKRNTNNVPDMCVMF